jgi:hypothetical protein
VPSLVQRTPDTGLNIHATVDGKTRERLGELDLEASELAHRADMIQFGGLLLENLLKPLWRGIAWIRGAFSTPTAPALTPRTQQQSPPVSAG